jgi:hypothetical protein
MGNRSGTKNTLPANEIGTIDISDLKAKNKSNPFLSGITNNLQEPIYNNPKKLAQKVYNYFAGIAEIDETGNVTSYKHPPTITGLALYLGYSSRQSFYELESGSQANLVNHYNKLSDKDLEETNGVNSLYEDSPEALLLRNDLTYVAKRARSIIENWYETGLSGNHRVAGSIFALKQFGWSDQQQISLNVSNELKAPEMSKDEMQDYYNKLNDNL